MTNFLLVNRHSSSASLTRHRHLSFGTRHSSFVISRWSKVGHFFPLFIRPMCAYTRRLPLIAAQNPKNSTATKKSGPFWANLSHFLLFRKNLTPFYEFSAPYLHFTGSLLQPSFVTYNEVPDA